MPSTCDAEGTPSWKEEGLDGRTEESDQPEVRVVLQPAGNFLTPGILNNSNCYSEIRKSRVFSCSLNKEQPL